MSYLSKKQGKKVNKGKSVNHPSIMAIRTNKTIRVIMLTDNNTEIHRQTPSIMKILHASTSN